jgi:hypothetical protein
MHMMLTGMNVIKYVVIGYLSDVLNIKSFGTRDESSSVVYNSFGQVVGIVFTGQTPQGIE